MGLKAKIFQKREILSKIFRFVRKHGVGSVFPHIIIIYLTDLKNYENCGSYGESIEKKKLPVGNTFVHKIRDFHIFSNPPIILKSMGQAVSNAVFSVQIDKSDDI